MTRIRAAMKIPEQRYVYFMSDDLEPVTDCSPLWDTSLPLSRHQQPHPGTTPVHKQLTYGEFFKAVSIFIETHLSDCIFNAIFALKRQSLSPHEISPVHIHLEKHGAFYHPAKILLGPAGHRIALVANVAFSTKGKNIVQNEYRLLRQLAGHVSPAWVPRVFGCDRVGIDDQRHIRVLLGEWFEGFHEFHVTEKRDSGETHLRVWDPENEALFMSRHQTQGILEQAAMILTAYYNVETSEQITSWHHAAGDFVVCLINDNPILKLVTVRGYEPLFNLSDEPAGLETILNTLMIFLLNLSIRLRVDRLDGVGDVAWVGADVIQNIMRGFFKGLVLQAENGNIPPEFIDALKIFLRTVPEKDIREIFMGIVNRINPKSPDLPVIKQHVGLHIDTFLSEIRQMKISA
jgi:hypothetical protein